MSALPIKFRGKIDYAEQERVFTRARRRKDHDKRVIRELVKEYEARFLKSLFNAKGNGCK